MSYGRALAVIAFISLTVACVGCSPKSIKIDGSSTVILITEAVTEQFAQEHPGVRVTGGRSGTGGGFKKFAAGEIDICDASRPIAESEKKACQEKGIEFIELEIAYDGIAVVVNPSNEWCESMTVAQLKLLWEPASKVKKWNELDPAWPAEEISLYGPGTDSGTFDYFTEVIVGKTGACRQDFSASEEDNVLVMGVAGDRRALGYFGLAYYEENKEKLKLLGIDAGDGTVVKPTDATVREGTYKPLSRPLYIYVKKSSLARKEMRSYLEYYLANVSKLAKEAGYVPLPDDILAKSKQTLEDALKAVPEQGS
ncbi:MAG: PstS family phosphate ABC transporter substrate-binding protein [Pirellulales bacterium]|nr:PstS family phosphate ABC transporter substrate-binding protein [Pirellulales bacterium]